MNRAAETKQQTARRFVGRVAIVLAFFVLAASSLVARAVYLQVLDKDFLNRQADTRHLHTEKISAHRGSITDRNGEPARRASGVRYTGSLSTAFPAADRVRDGPLIV